MIYIVLLRTSRRIKIYFLTVCRRDFRLCLKSLRHTVKKWILIRFIPFSGYVPVIQGIIALKRLDVKMSEGNVIPSLNGSQLYSSHPKQKCTKIYPEETAPGPRPLPYMGKILTFDRKVVEDPFSPFFYQNDRI